MAAAVHRRVVESYPDGVFTEIVAAVIKPALAARDSRITYLEERADLLKGECTARDATLDRVRDAMKKHGAYAYGAVDDVPLHERIDNLIGGLIKGQAARDAEIERLKDERTQMRVNSEHNARSALITTGRLAKAEARAATIRAATIEECAKVAEQSWQNFACQSEARGIATAIRALAPPAAVAPTGPLKVPSTETVPVCVSGGAEPIGYVTTTRTFHAEPPRERATCETCEGSNIVTEDEADGTRNEIDCPACAPKPEARDDAQEMMTRIVGYEDRVQALERERDEARATNRTLNRRVQEMESITADYRWAMENSPAPPGYEGIYAARRPREVIAELSERVRVLEAALDKVSDVLLANGHHLWEMFPEIPNLLAKEPA